MKKSEWDKTKKQVYGVTVIETTSSQDSFAADYCYRQLRKPYNYEFYRMDFKHKFYCSHLVRSAFIDLYNIDLNTPEFDILNARAIHPMELVNTSKTRLVYRKK